VRQARLDHRRSCRRSSSYAVVGQFDARTVGRYEMTSEIPVTALASGLSEVVMVAVVPAVGSLPDISESTAAPPAPVNWILYDLLRQAAGMLARFTWLTE
jgi:hypothetical protein